MTHTFNKILTLITVLVLIISCEDTDTPVFTEPDAGIVLLDPGVGTIVIRSNNLENQAVVLTWNDNSDASAGTYTVELGLDDTFETSSTMGTSDTNSFSITQAELNAAVIALGGQLFASNSVYFRVSSAGVVSNGISLLVTTTQDTPVLSNPVGGENWVLDINNSEDEAFQASWLFLDTASFEITYDLQVALASTDFAMPISLGTVTDANTLSVTTTTLNSAALDAGIEIASSGTLDIRLKASYTDTSGEAIETLSTPVTVTITTFTPQVPKVYIVGNFLSASGYGNDWEPASAVPLASSAFGATDFEGFVFMDVAATEFKILPTNESFDGDYGDDGSDSGILLQEGESNITLPSAGYYYIKANTDALTYEVIDTSSWGIIGAATPGGWTADTDMTYNSTTHVWTITIDLTGGEPYKFRANDDWQINLGIDSDDDGSLDFGGGNFIAETSGTYLVTLDLSNPRAYTLTVELQ